MKNNRIAVKLFLITTAVFILFISVTLFCQMFFFEKYYEQKKQANFSKDLYDLSETLSKETIDENSISDSFKKFDEDNSSKTIIVNIIKFNDYIINGTDMGDPSYIFYWFDRKINGAVFSQLVREWLFFYQSSYKDGLLNDKKTYVYKKHFGRTASIIGVAPVVSNNEVNNVIISMVSLQPVGDAVDTMKEFYIYIYIFAIVIIFILSTLYSVMISKPLVKLKKTASKMIELDFSTKCEIKTKDEIGELGSVLNFLSDKLDTTLSELKDSNEKLKEDIEKERQLEFMRKEFVAGVSHELKTPITLISGYAEALKDNVGREQDKDFFVEVIIDESKKMDYLIKEMLDLSQLETGNSKMNMEEFNISELVEFVLKKFTCNISDKNITVDTNSKDVVTMVSGDSIRIEQVLVNLISNAMKNIVDCGILTIRVEKMNRASEFEMLENREDQEDSNEDNRETIKEIIKGIGDDYSQEEDGNETEAEAEDEDEEAEDDNDNDNDNVGVGYMISIENEGKHIPEDELDKIWERFYKVDKSRTREMEGTGIGLSIVKNILLLHNSKFGVVNTGSGVKFYFTLRSLNKQ